MCVCVSVFVCRVICVDNAKSRRVVNTFMVLVFPYYRLSMHVHTVHYTPPKKKEAMTNLMSAMLSG